MSKKQTKPLKKETLKPAVNSKTRVSSGKGLVVSGITKKNEARLSAKSDKIPPMTPPYQNGKPNQKALPQIKRMVDKFDDMLRGKLEDLPAKPPSEVRIFLSSTFSDMRAERNWLALKAYPKLKDFCYSELDLDFRVLDMRWGITDDATNDHVTEQLCLAEIANCQRLSLGPSFVCILGDRYGFCPLPTEIPLTEFDIIQKEAEKMNHPQRHLLDDWYMRDDNAVPPLYMLQPIRTWLKHFADFQDGHEDLREEDTKKWYKVCAQLKDVVHKSVLAAEKKSLMKPERVHDFFKSVTEQELNAGLLKAKDPSQHCLCFVRTLTGLHNQMLSEKKATSYTDVVTNDSGQTVIDEEAASLRQRVKTTEVPKVLPKSQIFHYQMEWQEGGLDPAKHPPDATYLENFGTDFVGNIMKLILAAKHLRENQIPISEYYSYFDETLHHLHFSLVKCETFKGQTDALDRIHNYLLNSSKRKPLFVHAESGVGKTSVMAMVMKLVPQWFGGKTIRLIRFLGTSPYSTNIYEVLFSVAGQIADCCQKIMEPVGYKNMQKLQQYFPRFLRNMARSTKGHIVILLDSLDQLSPNDGTHSLKWLPLELPSNVHIIISTLPQTHGILNTAKKLIQDPDAFVELHPLPEKTGIEIIEAYLGKKRRTLTSEQKGVILAALAKVPSPLFLKLLLDQASSWKSYTSVSEVAIATSVRDAITRLFTGLEVKFGQLLISRALGYLTIGLNGLSEVELEDVLSCDDDVLNEIYQYHDPPIQGIVRLPPLLWARVKHDVSEYVAERQSQGKTTLYWYHRQFIEAARERYATESQVKLLHKNLADMFLATSGLKRDITLTKRKLTIPDADRQITAQPLVVKNKRKLMTLPYHLSTDLDRLKRDALCNLKFMQTKIQAFSVGELVQDYVNTIEGGGFTAEWGKGTEDKELELLRDCLRDVSRANNLSVELLARLERSDDLPHIASLLDEAEKVLDKGTVSTIRPLYPYLADFDSLEVAKQSLKNFFSTESSPTAESQDLAVVLQGKFVYKLTNLPAEKQFALLCHNIQKGQEETVKFSAPGKTQQHQAECFAISEDNTKIAIGCRTGQILAFEIRTQKCIHQFKDPSSGSIAKIMFTPSGDEILYISSPAKPTEHTLRTRSLVSKEGGSCAKLSGNPCAWAVSKMAEFVLVAALSNTGSISVCKVGIMDGTASTFPTSLQKGDNIAVSSTEDSILVGSGGIIKVVDLNTGAETKELMLQGDNHITDVILDPSDNILAGTKNGDIFVWQSEGFAFKGKMLGHSEDLFKMSIPINEEDDYLVLLSRDGTAKMLNIKVLLQNLATAESGSSGAEGMSNTQVKLNKYDSTEQILFLDDERLLTVGDAVVNIWDVHSHQATNTFMLNTEVAAADDVRLLKDKEILVMLVRSKGELKILNISSGAEIPHNTEGQVVAFSPGSTPNNLYILSKVKNKLCMTLFDLEESSVAKTIQITDSPLYVDLEMKLTISGKYMLFKMECTSKELEIINKSEKKNGLSISYGKYKFYSMDLKSKFSPVSLVPCYRKLTKILMLANCWEVQDGHCAIIGRGRIVCFLDPETGNHDQRCLKGTNKALFYRPGYIDGFGVPLPDVPLGCIATRCMQRSEAGNTIAIGSEDGYMVAYDIQGMGLVPSVGKSPNHGSPVCQVGVSPDGKWVAAVGENNILKVFAVPEKVKVVFSINFKVKVKKMTFSPDSKHLCIIVQHGISHSRVFLFKVIRGHAL